LTLVNGSYVNTSYVAASSVNTAMRGSVVTKSGKAFPHSAQIETPCLAALAILRPYNGSDDSYLALVLKLSIWFAFCFQVSIDRLKDTRSAVFRRKYDGELTLI